MTFTEKEQEKHREAFIKECRQKAWGAACNADWIGVEIDGLMAQYLKFEEEEHTLEATIKELANAMDYHTVENRNKRKALQERRDAIAPKMAGCAKAAQEGHRAMAQLNQSIETNLALAKHAETWEWKTVVGGKAEGGSDTDVGDAAHV